MQLDHPVVQPGIGDLADEGIETLAGESGLRLGRCAGQTRIDDGPRHRRAQRGVVRVAGGRATADHGQQRQDARDQPSLHARQTSRGQR